LQRKIIIFWGCPNFYIKKSMEDQRRRLEILTSYIDRESEQSLLTEQRIYLASQLLHDDLKALAFGITRQNAAEYVDTHLKLMPDAYAKLLTRLPGLAQNRGGTHPHGNRALDTMWNLWLPLATRLAAKQKEISRPYVQGILGGQGTGKTTLAIALTEILACMGLRCIGISIDDLYKTYAERQKLLEIDPRLDRRGPPGTHDVDLGIQVLDQLRQGVQAGAQATIDIPRFDKSAYGGAGDRTTPETTTGAEIILFEGWFVGAQPIDPAVFDHAPAPINTAADRQFAMDMNASLQDYLPLWQRLDSLIMLYPADYRYSKQWRQQAEQEAIASGNAGMSDEAVSEFVDYFWRALHPELFIMPLMRNAALVDLVVEINSEHQLDQIYSPRDMQN
jgi:D-glycerate 3-kinase